MDLLAIQLRAAQFTAHAAHNLVKGQTFQQDHSFFGEAYDAYTDAFDSLTERIIGQGDEPADILDWNLTAAKEARDACNDCSSPDAAYKALIAFEDAIQEKVEEYIDDQPSSGVANLIQGFADDSQTGQYKMQQRLGGKSERKPKSKVLGPKALEID